MIKPLLLVLAPLFSTVLLASDDLLIADFEGPDYGAWKVTGEAFGPGPAAGTLPGQMPVGGYKGKRLVNSFFKGDDSTGTLTSPEFKIERKFIGFLIGGGKNPDALSLRLLVNGRVVRSATGRNEHSGGSEDLEQESWDVGEFAGKTAVIEIIDNAKGGWGHINVDQIVQTDQKPAGMLSNAEREFAVQKHYLNLPVKNGAPKRLVTLLEGGKTIVRNEIELATGEPDWWAPMDVSAWTGKTVTLRVDKLPEDAGVLDSIEQSDTVKDAANLYHEPLRGQFHFSPQRGWNNDPNGMVFFNGEYHLFFQHNPYGWGWGNMHWGHAVSPDMVHWRELGDPLLPDEMGPMFSGSAVVDLNNTSGFGKEGHPPLVLFYTASGNPAVQCLAWSTEGRHFTKFEGNPIVKQVTAGNRDPKVIWYEAAKKWVMVFYVEQPGKHTVHFLTSANLREWMRTSITEGVKGSAYLAECPDFFELPVDGDAANKKWVLRGANTEYAVGAFDGTTFKPEQVELTGQRGRGFYAPQTFSDIPATDGRRIQIGWFQTETRGMPFNQSMSIPVELRLTTTAEGPRMTFTPVKELESLRAETHRLDALTLQPDDANPLSGLKAGLVEIHAEFAPEQATEIVFTVRGATIRYDAKAQILAVNDHRAPAPLRDGKQRLTIRDRTGLEVFASDGLTYVPMPFQPKADDLALEVAAKGGGAKFSALVVYELKSAWEPK